MTFQRRACSPTLTMKYRGSALAAGLFPKAAAAALKSRWQHMALQRGRICGCRALGTTPFCHCRLWKLASRGSTVPVVPINIHADSLTSLSAYHHLRLASSPRARQNLVLQQQEQTSSSQRPPSPLVHRLQMTQDPAPQQTRMPAAIIAMQSCALCQQLTDAAAR